MGQQEKAMGQESVGHLLLRFSIPIMLSYLVSELYSMVDTFFVGNYIGGLGVGSLNVVFPVQRILIAVAMMVALGVQTEVSNLLGQKHTKEASSLMNEGNKLVLAINIPLIALLFLVRTPLIRGLGAGSELMAASEVYLTGILPGALFLAWGIYQTQLLLALGKGSQAMVSTIIGALVNLVLDYFLVAKAGIGVGGAAIATSTSQFVAFLYSYSAVRRVRKEWGLTGRSSKVEFSIGGLLVLGLSSFVIEAEDGILIAVLNNLLGETMGEQGIVILGMTTRIYLFLFITICSIAAAMQPIASFNRGAHNYNRIKDVMKITRLAAVATSAVLWLGFMLGAPWIFKGLVKDPALVGEAVSAFRIMIAVFPVIGLYYVSIYYYQAIGRAKTSVFMAVFRQLIIMIPLSIVLVKVFDLGAFGVWISYPISDVVSAAFATYMLHGEEERLDRRIQKEAKQKRKEALAEV